MRCAESAGAPYGGSVPPTRLVDDLRRRDDPQLATLLALRGDLTRPAPVDIAALAARADTPASLRRAIEGLDEGLLAVLQCLALAERARALGASGTDAWAAALAGVGGPPDSESAIDAAAFERACRRLWDRALVARHEEQDGGGTGWRLRAPVLEALGPSVAELAPGPVDEGAVERARAELDALAPADRELLAALAWTSTGVFDASGPLAPRIRRLSARGLLEAGGGGGGTVRLPAPVALALRGGRAHRAVPLEPPDLAVRAGPGSVDAAAGAAAADFLTRVEELAHVWGVDPPRVLRSGGLAVAALRALGRALDCPAEHAAFVAELAYAAGLIDDDRQLEPTWAPTPSFDDWGMADAPRRWLILAQAWLGTTRAPHLIGHRSARADDAGAAGSAFNALSPAADSAVARSVRHDVLSLLATLPPGAATSPDAILTRLLWLRPLAPPEALLRHARGALAQGTWLGALADGGLSGACRALLRGAESRGPWPGADPLAAARAMLPEPVDHVLLQADLTAIAPGRLEDRLAAFLRLVADVESRDVATVYRFEPATVRRGLDAGWDAGRILATLEDASRTGVPQPLEYLVRDAARRHGGLRVGAATSYVRSDDPVAIDDLMARAELALYRPRRLADGVLACDAPPAALLGVLREAGLAPVAEGRDGAVVVPSTIGHRTPPRREHLTARLLARGSLAESGHSGGPREARSAAGHPIPGVGKDPAALVGALRAGDEARARDRSARRRAADAPLVRLSPGELAGYLRDAAAARRTLWLGVIDATGSPRRVLLRPQRVEGGRVHGADQEGAARSYSLHRIDGVAVAGPDGA